MRKGQWTGRGSTRRIARKAAVVRGGATIRHALDGPVAAMMAVGVVLIVCGWLAPAALRPHPNVAVYSVAQLRADLGRDPQRLAEQAVWVRGVLQSSVTFPCAFTGGPCAAAGTLLTGSDGASALGIPVVLEAASPLATWLRHLPIVGAMGPAAQALRWGVISTYRVQARRAAGRIPQVTLVVSDVDPQSP